ncbi:MAG: bifunctional 2-C-methyl-D-erythritol 4-phosphate cytidylyltransferase/2-C-methyl-D-erythritol 2,4-cyclodiphosphate synthase [Celeribacter sp.]|jgi:2-C-methyl-D-erythritol 4-phosphate cytidylyltransferase/2-C-methyl-D-erythritol 2,4-cyclodiphosphate synthase
MTSAPAPSYSDAATPIDPTGDAAPARGVSGDSDAPVYAAILAAAGRGTRMGGMLPKQFQQLGARAVLAHSYDALACHPRIVTVICVVHPDDRARAADLLPPGAVLVAGGADRVASVRAGLAALPDAATHVLIHDAARPLLPRAVTDRVIAALASGADGAAPALAVIDALWQEDSAGTVARAVPRDGLWRAQTPQGFALPALRAAHARTLPADAADDVAIARAAGLRVDIVAGAEDNFKLTHPGDLDRAARILRARDVQDAAAERPLMDIRTGNGYDVHRFGADALGRNDRVTLCGVEIPHTRGLQGHSDADVGMHALTDALYGALAEGDIGRHFPPSDPQWKGAASEVFLAHAIDLARARGFGMANCDVTLICEYPKIGPHADAMRATLARITGTEVARISVKATTSERLGFTGRGEGIAAIATVTLISPAPTPSPNTPDSGAA